MKTLVLEGVPQSTNHLYKPTARGIYLTQDGKDLKDDYIYQALSQWTRPPLEGPLEVTVKLCFSDKRRRDWDNWHKLSMDALSGIAYEDDSQIEVAHVFKVIDRERPRIEITLSPVVS